MTIDFASYGWPQFVTIGLYVFHLVTEARDHGQPKTGKHNVLTTIIHMVIAIFILRSGGFF